MFLGPAACFDLMQKRDSLFTRLRNESLFFGRAAHSLVSMQPATPALLK
jgi:hypothetical protein